ncbi:hypothetical protein SDC9_131199 [bioreactor metagenome]|uniref:Uncharacterized protein n=1 Tax=bioreactor metagenome TaxID=1076179 RepID=A0A645D4X5_9ZZZZ
MIPFGESSVLNVRKRPSSMQVQAICPFCSMGLPVREKHCFSADCSCCFPHLKETCSKKCMPCTTGRSNGLLHFRFQAPCRCRIWSVARYLGSAKPMGELCSPMSWPPSNRRSAHRLPPCLTPMPSEAIRSHFCLDVPPMPAPAATLVLMMCPVSALNRR